MIECVLFLIPFLLLVPILIVGISKYARAESPEEKSRAQKAITGVVVGIVVIVLAKHVVMSLTGIHTVRVDTNGDGRGDKVAWYKGSYDGVHDGKTEGEFESTVAPPDRVDPAVTNILGKLYNWIYIGGGIVLSIIGIIAGVKYLPTSFLESD